MYSPSRCTSLGTRRLSSCTHLLGTRVEELVVEAGVGFEQVGLDALGRLDGHLGAVLEDEDRELGTGHARQPQPEVTVHLEQSNRSCTHSSN